MIQHCFRCIRFYQVLSGFIRFYQVLSGFIRRYQVVQENLDFGTTSWTFITPACAQLRQANNNNLLSMAPVSAIVIYTIVAQEMLHNECKAVSHEPLRH
jgi:hypothetical protein